MATTENARNLMLENDSPRTLAVELPSDYTTTGDHSGTLDGSAQVNFQNGQITLSSTGVLQNAGGGQITNGASIGSLNAGNITTGTLSAARIGANSITASHIASNTITANELAANSVTANELNVSTLSAITANLGTVTAGDITGTADINISGRGTFNGSTSIGGYSGAVHANDGNGSSYGLVGFRSGSGACIVGSGTSGASGVVGQVNSTGAALVGIHTSAGTALQISSGVFVTNSSALVNNLRAERATTADSVLGSNVSGTVSSAANASNATNASNAGALGGVDDSGWGRIMVTDSGSAAASSFGFVLTSTVSGVRTRATGGRNVVIESFSDDELKFSIKPETLGLDFITKLQPITYRVKDNPSILHHGLSAQAVKQHIKGNDDALAITHDDGVLGVDYMSMVGVLVKAVQEMAADIEKLKEKIK